MKKQILGSAVMATILALGAGCGDEEKKTPIEPGPDAGPNGTEATETVVFSADSTANVTYLARTKTLGEGVTTQFTGVEIPGVAIGVSFGDDPHVYVGTPTSTIHKYEVSPSGMVEVDSVSLENEGTTSTTGYQTHLVLVDRTKAFFVDTPNDQVVFWNPTEMTVTGSIDFSTSIAKQGARLGISGFPLVIGTKHYYGVGWLNGSTLDVIGGATVLIIDTAANTATVVSDPAERCGYSFSIVEGTDGLYVGTEAFGAAQHALSPSSVEPCMLRFDPATQTFDSTYQVSLGGLVGGAPAGTLVPGASPGQAYLRVLDLDALGYTIEEWKTGGVGGASLGNARVLSTHPSWAWYTLTLGETPTASLLAGSVESSGATLGIRTGNGTLVPEYDGPRTKLRAFDGDVYGEIVVDAAGNVRSAAQVVYTTPATP